MSDDLRAALYAANDATNGTSERHRVKAGRKPRVGYLRGKPIS